MTLAAPSRTRRGLARAVSVWSAIATRLRALDLALRSSQPRRWDGAALFGAALCLRVASALWGAPRFPPAEDGHFYHVVAGRIAAGDGYTWLWPDGAVTYAAHYPVGYPALIGAVYALFGAHVIAAMLFNALLGSVGAWATYRLAAVAAPRAGALLAGLAVALHPTFVFYTPALMTEAASAAIVVIAAFLLVGSGQKTLVRLLCAGLVLGVGTLVRPQLILLAPVFGALLAPSAPVDGRTPSRRLLRRLINGALVTALALAVCVPWTARNCARMNRCVFVSANGGWNLLIGTRSGPSGGWVPLERDGVPSECRLVFAEAEKDVCFGRAARVEIGRDPGRWLATMPAKLGATYDYVGAAAYYLRSSNGSEFSDAAKLRLGVAETAWQRVLVLLSLVALARAEGPRRRVRGVLAAVFGVFLFMRSAWIAYLGLVLCSVLLGRSISRHVTAGLAAWTVLTTSAIHAVFFGAGRYGVVCFTLVAAVCSGVFGARVLTVGSEEGHTER